MKREFLQNLQVGDMTLSKEVIDAIMAENGRDIEAAKSAFADYDEVKAELLKARSTIEAFQSQDTQSLQQAVKDWEEKYSQAEEDHNARLAEMAFSHCLEKEIFRTGGRNSKAITALLDVEALQSSENQAEAVKKAVEALKKESPYLFATEEFPPLFARGTGASTGIPEKAPATLAGALRERFEKERK